MKIISGGQTGADQGGLKAANALGFQTGGFAPQFWQTENGPMPYLLGVTYGLEEYPSAGYAARTSANVEMAQGTVIFGKISSPGSALTVQACRKMQKSFIHIKMSEEVDYAAMRVLGWIERHRFSIVNVAGNRESVSPGIQQYTHNVMYAALAVWKRRDEG